MKSAAVLHVNSATYGSLSPTMRIARFAAETMGIPLIHNAESAEAFQHDAFDTLFVKYGVLKFSQHRDAAVSLCNRARRIVSLENDYLMHLDKRLREPDLRWGTVQPCDQYINWNMVSWEHGLKPQDVKIKGIYYHGAYRTGREKYFERYFSNAPYQVTVSSFRGGEKFRALSDKIITLPGSSTKMLLQLQHAQMALYIEDEYSHTHYTSPATRFYECLHRGTPMIFDVSCINTFEQAGYDILPYVVRNQKEAKAMLKRSEEIRFNQRAVWYRNYLTELRKQVQRAARTL